MTREMIRVYNDTSVKLHSDRCPVETIRAGKCEPCDKLPVALRWLEHEGVEHATPVCVAHCRVGEMVGLDELLSRVAGSPRWFPLNDHLNKV